MLVSYKVMGEGATEKIGKIQSPYGNDKQYIGIPVVEKINNNLAKIK